MMREGVVAEQFLEAAPYFLALTVPSVVPLAFVVAVSAVISRAATQNELLALSAAGASSRSVTRVLYVLAILMSIPLWFINDRLLPSSNEARLALVRSLANDLLGITNGEDKSIPLPSKDPKSDKMAFCRKYQDGYMEDIIVFGQDKGRDFLMSGKKGKLQLDKESEIAYLALEKVRIQQKSNTAVDVIECDKYILAIPLEPAAHPREEFADIEKLLSSREAMKRYLSQETNKEKRAKIELYLARCEAEITKRITMSVSPILLLFLILPVSILLGEKKRGGAPFVAVGTSVLFFYIPSMVSVAIARRGSEFALMLPASAALVSIIASIIMRFSLRRA
jgi:lipopolysaccharide export LptBFGC system permease protein LptF